MGEEAEPAQEDFLFAAGEALLLLPLGRDERLIEVGASLQLPVLVHKVHRLPRQPQALGHVAHGDKAVELILQLLQALLALAQTDALRVGKVRSGAGVRIGVPALPPAPSTRLLSYLFLFSILFFLACLETGVLRAEGLEFDLVCLCEDGAHLEACALPTGDVERRATALGRTLREEDKDRHMGKHRCTMFIQRDANHLSHKEIAPATATEFRNNSLNIIGPEWFFHANNISTVFFTDFLQIVHTFLSVWFIPFFSIREHGGGLNIKGARTIKPLLTRICSNSANLIATEFRTNSLFVKE